MRVRVRHELADAVQTDSNLLRFDFVKRAGTDLDLLAQLVESLYCFLLCRCNRIDNRVLGGSVQHFVQRRINTTATGIDLSIDKNALRFGHEQTGVRFVGCVDHVNRESFKCIRHVEQSFGKTGVRLVRVGADDVLKERLHPIL